MELPENENKGLWRQADMQENDLTTEQIEQLLENPEVYDKLSKRLTHERMSELGKIKTDKRKLASRKNLEKARAERSLKAKIRREFQELI